MATFTHTITWTVVIEGVSTLYKYTYQITDIDDVERVNVSQASMPLQHVYRSEPVLVACVVKGARGSVNIVDNTGPTNIGARYTEPGDMVVFHLSDGGGTWNVTNSDATTTLVNNDQIVAGGINGSTNSGVAMCDLLVLHQPAS